MSEINSGELNSKIERQKDKINSTLERWDSIPEEQKPYFRLARSARSIGVYFILLGNQKESDKWFTKATAWFRDNREKVRNEHNEPQIAMWSLVMAVLSTKDGLAKEVAVEIVEEGIKHTSPTYFTYFAEGLAHLILGNDDAVNEIGDSLTTLEPDAPENLDFYPGLGDAHKSIVAEDLDALETALERVLSWHSNEMVPMLGELSDDALVCFPAIVFLLLAHKRGLEIRKLDVLDSEYIPEALFNRAL